VRKSNSPATLHGYLVAVAIEEDATITTDQIGLRLGDATSFIEGVAHSDVEYLGEIEVVPEGTSHES
jgi:hypothetical protein